MIIQGTTPTHTFNLPFDSENIKRARFVYSQAGVVKIIKDSTDTDTAVTLDEGKASTTLAQADTFNLDPDVVVELVLRLLTANDTAMETKPVYMVCKGSADKEVLT